MGIKSYLRYDPSTLHDAGDFLGYGFVVRNQMSEDWQGCIHVGGVAQLAHFGSQEEAQEWVDETLERWDKHVYLDKIIIFPSDGNFLLGQSGVSEEYSLEELEVLGNTIQEIVRKAKNDKE